jgi:hypothetical protein
VERVEVFSEGFGLRRSVFAWRSRGVGNAYGYDILFIVYLSLIILGIDSRVARLGMRNLTPFREFGAIYKDGVVGTGFPIDKHNYTHNKHNKQKVAQIVVIFH